MSLQFSTRDYETAMGVYTMTGGIRDYYYVDCMFKT